MRKIRTIEMNRLTVEEFKNSDKLPVTVVLDNIRSLYNVGSIFRTSDAFRLERIMLCGVSGCPPNTEIHKTALGAEDSVEWLYFKDTLDAVRKLKDDGCFIYSVEQVEHSTKLQELRLYNNHRYAVIFGNEVKGVRQDVVDACDGCIEIPQFGTKHSLNVSVTAGIIIWEFTRLLKL
jgi:tRNA G18 (ribose-2'-O)-methylase SpoU